MRPNISNTARAALAARNTSSLLPILLEITHGVAGYADPLRIVCNTENLTYNGNVYTAFTFKFDPPDVKNDGTIANARITVCAVDQMLAAIIRSTNVPPTVTAIATFYNNDSGLVFEPLATMSFTVREVSGDEAIISAELIYEDSLDNEVPVDEFRPETHPGLH